jgi:hypothetical protein
MKLLFVFLILLPYYAGGTITTRQGCEHVVDQNSISIAWNAVVGATKYQWQSIFIDLKTPKVLASGETSQTQVTMSYLRAGHFRYQVRACDATSCSDWTDSLNVSYSTCNASPGAWWIYFKLPAPVIN